jgi:hypothetical protein
MNYYGYEDAFRMLSCRMGCFSFEAPKETKVLVSRRLLALKAMPHKAKTWAATFCPASLT